MSDNIIFPKCYSCNDYILRSVLQENKLCENCYWNYDIIIYKSQAKKLYGLTDEDIDKADIFCIKENYKKTKKETTKYLIRDIEKLASNLVKDLPDDNPKKITYLIQIKIKEDKKKEEEQLKKRKQDFKKYLEILFEKYSKTYKDVVEMDKEDYIKYIIYKYSFDPNTKFVDSVNRISTYFENVLKNSNKIKNNEIEYAYAEANAKAKVIDKEEKPINTIPSYYLLYYSNDLERERLKEVYKTILTNERAYSIDELCNEKIVKKYVNQLDNITLDDLKKHFRKMSNNKKKKNNFIFHEWEDWRKIADQKLGDLEKLDIKIRKELDIKLFSIEKENNEAYNFCCKNEEEKKYVVFRCSQLFLKRSCSGTRLYLYLYQENNKIIRYDRTKVGP